MIEHPVSAFHSGPSLPIRASSYLLFRPSWLEKLQPYVPIKPNSGQGRWIPLAATLKCPTCGTDVNLPFPVDKQRASYDWFGDEAYRETDDKFVVTYSLVGTNRVRLPIVEDEVRRFKAQLCPSISPDSWHLHMLEIWSGQKRKEHSVFRTWDAAYVVRFADDFFRLIRNFDEAFKIFNVSAI
jgi:hypothetical protein